MTSTRLFQIAILCALILPVMACSTSGSGPQQSPNSPINDPFESANRATFAFNTVVDDNVIEPIIEGYRFITPQPARTGLRNFLRNLGSPINFANQVLQGDVEGAKNVFLRTSINTLVGVGGLFDVAGYEGIEYEAEDFGQTLAVWGLGHGPYFVMPFFGPSSLRDGTGFAVDAIADPFNYYVDDIGEESLTVYRAGLSYVDLRNSLHDVLKDLQRNSFDYYAATRSAYYQRREALVMDLANGVSSATSGFDDIY